MQPLRKLVGLQRRAAADVAFCPDPHATEVVSTQKLEALLEQAAEVSDIRANPGISNCLVFNTTGLDGAVEAPEVVDCRTHVDVAVSTRLAQLGAIASTSGHFLYPDGGHMGWHTNDRVPGWRVYLTNAEAAGQSFFRYRTPGTGEIVTSWDTGWDLRVFRIDPAAPLWHAVYSATNRTSLGYRIESSEALSAEDIADALGVESRSD